MAKGKSGRNKVKCERYRATKGKPRGPGRKGKKSGSGFVPVAKAKA